MNEKLLIILFLTALINPINADLRPTIDTLRFAIEKTPNDYLLHFKLGGCYYSMEEYESALHEFSKTLELNLDYSIAKYKIALVYYEMDSFEIARAEFNELLKTYSDSVTIYSRLACIYGYLGAYDRMLQAYQEYGRETGYDFSYACGMACALMGDYKTAIDYYRKAMGTYNVDELVLSMLYHHANNDEEATKWFKKSLPRSYKPVHYYLFSKFDEAIEIVDDLVAHNEADWLNYYNRGVFRIASGDAGGTSDMRKAVDLDTAGFVQAVVGALDAVKTDSFANAEIYLKQKISYLRSSGIALGLLAWTLEKLGKETEAKKYWFRCYGLLPLGIDVPSMRKFIDGFVNTTKNQN